MFYEYKNWINDHDFVYLGSEINPATKLKYDYWVYIGKCNSDTSFLCRHGIEPHEYGSGPICIAHYDTTHFKNRRDDYIFGIERAKILTLYYLATREKPLLQDSEFTDFLDQNEEELKSPTGDVNPSSNVNPWNGQEGDGWQ